MTGTYRSETPGLLSAVTAGLGLPEGSDEELVLARLKKFFAERRRRPAKRVVLDRGRALALGGRLSTLERKLERQADRAGELTPASEDRALRGLLEAAGLKPRVGRDGRLLRHESGSVKLDR